MISGFESYAPSAWYDANGLMLPGKTHKSVSTNSQRSKPKRSGSWRVIVSNTAAGACLAISALLLPTNTSVAMTAAAPVNTDDLTVAPTVQNEAVALSPIREINRSFNQLFDSVRLGHSLIPSDDLRFLAKRALQSQKDKMDIESWATKLATDTKDAKD